MAAKKKFKTPTVLKNLRVSSALNDWLRKRARSTGISQTDIILDSIAKTHPETKGLLS